MATSSGRTELRLRGLTRSHGMMALAAAAPMVNLLYQWQKHGGALSVAWWVWSGCAVVLTLPWIARGVVRALHRPSMDAHGVFVGEHALPFAKISEVVIGKKGRRRYLFLRRDKKEELVLILEDPYAGKLMPLGPLAQRLAQDRPEDPIVRKLVAEAGGDRISSARP